jgi:hypothetical protein
LAAQEEPAKREHDHGPLVRPASGAIVNRQFSEHLLDYFDLQTQLLRGSV